MSRLMTVRDLPWLLGEVERAEANADQEQHGAEEAERTCARCLERAAEAKAQSEKTTDPLEWARYKSSEAASRVDAALADTRAQRRRAEANDYRKTAEDARAKIEEIRLQVDNFDGLLNADSVRAAIKRVLKAPNGRNRATFILRTFGNGAKSVSDLDPAYYANVVNRVDREFV